MKLELKHILPYIPYGIKAILTHDCVEEYVDFIEECDVDEKIFKEGAIWTIGGYTPVDISHGDGEITDFIYTNDSCYIGDNGYFKPILRPLSDLTKEELKEAGFTDHVDYLTHEQFCKNKHNFPILRAPYRMIDYLFSKHYDVFGLIEAGIAIDINTINK